MSRRVSILGALLALVVASVAQADGSRGTILLTGFEPFGSEPVNPSWQAIRRMNGQVIDGYTIRAIEMPVDAARVDALLSQVIPELKPVALISFGQGHPGKISLERRADNRVTHGQAMSSRDGTLTEDEPIRADAPMFYSSTLPLGAFETALRTIRAGHEWEYSDDPGDYVCEYTMFVGRYLMERNGGGPSGFIHVPIIDSGSHSAVEDSRGAAELIVRTLASELRKKAEENAAPVTSASTASDTAIVPSSATTTTDTTASVATRNDAARTVPNVLAGPLGDAEDVAQTPPSDGEKTSASKPTKPCPKTRTQPAGTGSGAPAARPATPGLVGGIGDGKTR